MDALKGRKVVLSLSPSDQTRAMMRLRNASAANNSSSVKVEEYFEDLIMEVSKETG